jgi:acylpyruvate hydrolase
MKLVVFNNMRLGALVEDNVIDLNYAYASLLAKRGAERPYEHADAHIPVGLYEFILEGNSGLKAAKEAVEHAQDGIKGPKGERIRYKAEEVSLKAPLPSLASRLIMAGANFYDHTAGMMGGDVTIEALKKMVEEGGRPPWGFYKHARMVIGPGGSVIYPSKTDRLDYEVEIGAVIGKKGKDISEEDAMSYVYGYTVVLDMSCRSMVGGPPRTGGRGPNNELVSSKRFDTCAPMGPCIVTADEVEDPHNMKLGLNVNGEVRQNGNTNNMIRGYPWWINHVTRDLTLYPGDIVCGGTCAGTAADLTPRGPERRQAPDLFLKPGDEVECWADFVGSMKINIASKK